MLSTLCGLNVHCHVVEAAVRIQAARRRRGGGEGGSVVEGGGGEARADRADTGVRSAPVRVPRGGE